MARWKLRVSSTGLRGLRSGPACLLGVAQASRPTQPPPIGALQMLFPLPGMLFLPASPWTEFLRILQPSAHTSVSQGSLLSPLPLQTSLRHALLAPVLLRSTLQNRHRIIDGTVCCLNLVPPRMHVL